jgi:hypothetical protein
VDSRRQHPDGDGGQTGERHQRPEGLDTSRTGSGSNEYVHA